MLSENAIAELRKPLDPRRVTTMQSGPAVGVPYLTAWDCIERANEIFGPAGWSFDLVGTPWVIESGVQGNASTKYEVWAAMGRVTVAGASYSDIGTNVRSGEGSGGLEMAVKGAVSDALKRCLRLLGDQFGLVLYDKSLGRTDLEAMYQESQQTTTTPPSPAPHQPAPANDAAPTLAEMMRAAHITVPDLARVIPIPDPQKLNRATIDYWLQGAPGRTERGLVDAVVAAKREQVEAMAKVGQALGTDAAPAAAPAPDNTPDGLFARAQAAMAKHNIRAAGMASVMKVPFNRDNLAAYCAETGRSPEDLVDYARDATRQTASTR